MIIIEKIKFLAKHNGEETILRQLTEELSEAAVESQKIQRAINENDTEEKKRREKNLVKELADVEVMKMQYLNCSKREDKLSFWEAYRITVLEKIDRQIERIRKEG